MTTITIGQDDGTVVCTPKSGNVRVNRRGSVTWQIRTKGQLFRLTFRYEPFQGMPPKLGDWPFSGTLPTAPSTDWVDQFDATAIDGDGVFKYLVEVRDANGDIARLDPIIIIKN
jgi:hypothetical protein